MIHDLLLGMLGFTGDIVEFDGIDSLVLCSKVKLERFDREIISGLLKIGGKYTVIRDWVDNVHRDISNSRLYDIVLSSAVDDLILTVYEGEIADMEKTLLECGDGITLSAIRLKLHDKWSTVFDDVISLIVSRGDEPVIDSLMAGSLRNEPIRKIYEKLISSFSRELVSWCKHGIIPGGPNARS